MVFFHFYPNFKRNFCNQNVNNLIRRRVLRRLIWFCTVCRCPTKRTLGLYGLNLNYIDLYEVNITTNLCFTFRQMLEISSTKAFQYSGLLFASKVLHVKVYLPRNSRVYVRYSHRIGGNRKRCERSANADQKSLETVFSIAILSPVGRQMAIENFVSNYFLSTFVDSFRLPPIRCDTLKL